MEHTSHHTSNEAKPHAKVLKQILKIQMSRLVTKTGIDQLFELSELTLVVGSMLYLELNCFRIKNGQKYLIFNVKIWGYFHNQT